MICAGLATRFSFSVVGVQIRRAVRRGARLVVVDARESTLARAADDWLPAEPGAEAAALTDLLGMLAGDPASGGHLDGIESRFTAAARLLDGAATLAVVVGPRVFHSLGADGLTAALERSAARDGVTVLPLTHGANIRGALELGALAGVLPGPRPAPSGLTLEQLREGRRPKVLYLVGETPFATRPDCDYLIAQDLYLPPFQVDAFLPAASFVEAEGTLTNVEGRVQELRAVERPAVDPVHGYARPDWRIFAALAVRLGGPALDVTSAAGMRSAIRDRVPGFPAEGDRSPRRMTPLRPPSVTAGDGDGGWAAAAPPVSPRRPRRLRARAASCSIPEPAAFRHRGIDLADVVEGLGELRLEEGLRMNPDDLARLGVEADGPVTILLDGHDLVLAARRRPRVPPGRLLPVAHAGVGRAAAPRARARQRRRPVAPLAALAGRRRRARPRWREGRCRRSLSGA